MSLVHAEYLKLSRRKFFPIMLIILFVLVLFSAFFLISFGQLWPDLANEVPVLGKPDAFVIGAQQVAAQTWFPLIVATVILGGDLASTVWATSLTREPSVIRHVGSRLLVFSIASWLAYILATGAWALYTHIWAPGRGGLELGEWLGVTWRLGVGAAVWTALGLAAVALLRQVGPAIGAVLAFYFVEQLLGLWPTYAEISLTAATNGLFGVYLDGWLGEFVPGAGMSVARALTVIGGWTVFALGLTWWGLRRRDA